MMVATVDVSEIGPRSQGKGVVRWGGAMHLKKSPPPSQIENMKTKQLQS